MKVQGNALWGKNRCGNAKKVGMCATGGFSRGSSYVNHLLIVPEYFFCYFKRKILFPKEKTSIQKVL